MTARNRRRAQPPPPRPPGGADRRWPASIAGGVLASGLGVGLGGGALTAAAVPTAVPVIAAVLAGVVGGVVLLAAAALFYCTVSGRDPGRGGELLAQLARDVLRR